MFERPFLPPFYLALSPKLEFSCFLSGHKIIPQKRFFSHTMGFFISQNRVFLARLFSFGPQKMPNIFSSFSLHLMGFFFSQNKVFLARLFSIGQAQKTIGRLLRSCNYWLLLRWASENLEKTDRESGNWRKDVFNYRKQWKQFSTSQTNCLILQTDLPPPPLPNIFIGKIYSPSNHLPTKCHAHLSTPAKRMNRTHIYLG